MKFALIDGKRCEATKGAQGFCSVCGEELIAKCGEIKIHHWSHKVQSNCDPWWENETEWHRFWKNQFPLEWQEVIHIDKTGEKHIADVKTEENWVLEFQHSPINAVERESRNIFYTKVVWIINGLRLEKDKQQFQNILNNSTSVKYGNIFIYRVSNPKDSSLLNHWYNSGVPVFFDFNESKNIEKLRLWLLIPKTSNDVAYMFPFSGIDFIKLHHKKGFNEMANEIIPNIKYFLLRYEQSKNQISFFQPRSYRRRF